MWHHQKWIGIFAATPRQEALVAQGAGPVGTTGSSSGRICLQKSAGGWIYSIGLSLPQTSALADPTALLGNSLIVQLFCTLINFSLLLGEQQLWGLLTEWIIAKISSCLYELFPYPLTRFLVGVFVVFCWVWVFCLISLTLGFSLMWMSGEVLVI